jgi:hypothetical protein
MHDSSGPTIPAFERSTIVHTLHRATTVIGHGTAWGHFNLEEVTEIFKERCQNIMLDQFQYQ